MALTVAVFGMSANGSSVRCGEVTHVVTLNARPNVDMISERLALNARLN